MLVVLVLLFRHLHWNQKNIEFRPEAAPENCRVPKDVHQDEKGGSPSYRREQVVVGSDLIIYVKARKKCNC